MDIQRAKELLTALADGLDPLTGEVLPSDHMCNKGDIVRALHCVLEALPRGQKKPLPANHGKPWTEKADQELCSLFDSGMTKKSSVPISAAPPEQSIPVWSGWGKFRENSCNKNVAPQATKPSFECAMITA